MTRTSIDMSSCLLNRRNWYHALIYSLKLNGEISVDRSIDWDFSLSVVSVSKDCKCLPDGCIICSIILVSQRIIEYARTQLDPSVTSLCWFLTLEPQVLLFRRLLREEWWIRRYSTVTGSCFLFVHWFIRQMKSNFTITLNKESRIVLTVSFERGMECVSLFKSWDVHVTKPKNRLTDVVRQSIIPTLIMLRVSHLNGSEDIVEAVMCTQASVKHG